MPDCLLSKEPMFAATCVWMSVPRDSDGPLDSDEIHGV
jgi:hypothetical protein